RDAWERFHIRRAGGSTRVHGTIRPLLRDGATRVFVRERFARHKTRRARIRPVNRRAEPRGPAPIAGIGRRGALDVTRGAIGSMPTNPARPDPGRGMAVHGLW